MTAPDFLYPMLEEGPAGTPDLLADLARSARSKAQESARLRADTLTSIADQLGEVASAMAAAFRGGGRLFCFGNGGSATDAAGLVAAFATGARPLPARSLSADPAVLTALANDIGVEVVFARQLIAFGRAGDIALGLSTSGGSANVLRAFAQARRLGMLTVGLAGYGGGPMRSCTDLDHCLTVEAQSIHRTQEVQSAVAHALWQRVLAELQGPA